MALSIEEHEQRAAHIERLLQQVSLFSDQEMRATTEELIRAILDLHGEGLARILAIIAEAGGDGALEPLVSDGLVSSLLLLHGLHPVDPETRIRHALADLETSLHIDGAGVTLMSIADGTAYVRLMSNNCHGCSASTEMLRAAIEEAVSQVAPELEGVQIEDGAVKQAVPVTFIPPRRHRERESDHASISPF
ncbi:hypothetical protein KSF_073830 [Reticulibacter mediterranei]|uniref:NIF system FeS cluster assembly NifU C-terminal domain-containing protein n=1 Tax=Reticulibacter mediterranei TaxID=2778369 RepID=A0A8J3IUZ9_9CHLR|nr:NifU family protein [Reticulibacter mediterranei]GHO97335.1 hypothetical protein KSF_073830 [Reticulibacter mediterranei]